jgi:hypothetical protein
MLTRRPQSRSRQLQDTSAVAKLWVPFHPLNRSPPKLSLLTTSFLFLDAYLRQVRGMSVSARKFTNVNSQDKNTDPRK